MAAISDAVFSTAAAGPVLPVSTDSSMNWSWIDTRAYSGEEGLIVACFSMLAVVANRYYVRGLFAGGVKG